MNLRATLPYIITGSPSTNGKLHNISAATRYYPTSTPADCGIYVETEAEVTVFMRNSGGVTFTFEHAPGVPEFAPEAGDWQDITSQFRKSDGTSAATYVDATAEVSKVLLPGWLRVKSVTSDATNDLYAHAVIKPVADGAGSQPLPAGAATEARQTSSTCVSVAAKTAPATPAAATAIAASSAAKCGVLVSADLTNGGTIALGGSGVAIGTGVELQAGDSVFLPVSDPSLVYCVGSAAAQVLRVVVL